MKKVLPFVLFVPVLGVSTAAAQDVTYNFDQGTDFSKFKTYKWVSIRNAEKVDEITARQITQAINEELAKRA